MEKLEQVRGPSRVIWGSAEDNPEGHHQLLRQHVADAAYERQQARLEERAEAAARVARAAVMEGARTPEEVAEALRRAGLGR